MTTMDDDTLRAILDGLRHGPVHITANRCSGDSRALAAFCDLVRVAPALAAEVLRLRDAARAHLAADDALSLARRTDAADVPTAEARADAARECLAGLVGYVGEVGR